MSSSSETNFEHWLRRDRSTHTIRTPQALEMRIYGLHKRLLAIETGYATGVTSGPRGSNNECSYMRTAVSNYEKLISILSCNCRRCSQRCDGGPLDERDPIAFLKEWVEDGKKTVDYILTRDLESEGIRREGESWLHDITTVDCDYEKPGYLLPDEQAAVAVTADYITAEDVAPDDHGTWDAEVQRRQEYPFNSRKRLLVLNRCPEQIEDDDEPSDLPRVVNTTAKSRKRRRLNELNPFLDSRTEVPAPLPDDYEMGYLKLYQAVKRKELSQ